MAITADYLLAGVKRRCILPSNQATLQDSDILAMGDEIVKSCIVPLLESVDEEYFVTPYITPIVGSQSLYALPYRAVGRNLRKIKLIDSNNNVRNVAKIALEDAHTYTASSNVLGFYFIGDQIRLVPDVPSSIGLALSIEFWYRLPPNSLCTLSNAALVTSVTSTTVNVASLPSNIVNGSVIDFIQGQSGNALYSIDQTITGISGLTLSFGAGVIPATAPNVLKAGDYISLAATSPVLNSIPNECSSYLESLVTERVLQSIGDFDGAAVIMPIIAREKENLLKLLDPRTDGEPTIIINRWGLVRGNKFAQRRWLYGS